MSTNIFLTSKMHLLGAWDKLEQPLKWRQYVDNSGCHKHY